MDLFFELIQVALGTREELSRVPNAAISVGGTMGSGLGGVA